MLTDNERETLREVARTAHYKTQTGIPCDLVAEPLLAAVESLLAAREGVWRAPIEALCAKVEQDIAERLAVLRLPDDGKGGYVSTHAIRAALGSVSAPGTQAGQ